MINYNSSSSLKTFLDQEGLGMQKKFGQNFLVNPSVRQTLVEKLAAPFGEEVWEIGPGLGAMTSILLEKGLKVRAFEVDKGFMRILKQLFSGNENFIPVEGDVLKTHLAHCPDKKARFLFGNLPYNIAAFLLAQFIEEDCLFERMVITVQKETALRMAASWGSPDYSSLSVLCACAYKVKPFITIKPSSFFPQPNVDSMGVLFENKNAELRPVIFTPLVRALFSSRRKMIKNNLSNFVSSVMLSADKDICESILSENSLTGSERAENLEPEVFLSLAKSIENMRKLKKGCQ